MILEPKSKIPFLLVAMRKKAIFLIILILIVYIGLFIIVTFKPQKLIKPITGVNSVFVKTYPHAVLENLWLAYRDKIQKDGRTIDRSRDFLTTSEGQSYSLLRSVWMDDKETFDNVLKWTNNNLRQREDDNLFAWKWGRNPDGSWDVLVEEGGMNTASDADQDIALALIFAYKRWNQEHYLKQAIQILNDIWKQEVITVNGKYYLLAGNWAKSEPQPTVNPSYFSFAAYPIFADVDLTHPWLELRESSYDVLEEATLSNLDFDESANIPPDWVNLELTTGKVLPVLHGDKDTNFSDDAYRIIWRVGLDWKWHKNERAKEFLKKLSFLENEWKTQGKLIATYKHSGEPVDYHESNSMYGATLAYFDLMHPYIAQDIYLSKLAVLYNSDTEEFAEDIGYYSQNWVWLGMAFYEDKLPNLFEVEGVDL